MYGQEFKNTERGRTFKNFCEFSTAILKFIDLSLKIYDYYYERRNKTVILESANHSSRNKEA